MPLPTYLRNQFNHCSIHWIAFYFGGARSKGFATLRNVSKLTFFDKIGHAKSVGFEFNSAIWRSKSRISSRYLEITSSTLIFPRKKELLFWLYRDLNRLTCVTRQIGETLNWGISRLRYCEPKNLGVSILVIECALRAGSSDLVWVLPKRQNKMADIILARQRDYPADVSQYPVAFICCKQ